MPKRYFGRDLKDLPAIPRLHFTEREFAAWMAGAFFAGAGFVVVLVTALSMGVAK